jgi:hypothetical protein
VTVSVPDRPPVEHEPTLALGGEMTLESFVEPYSTVRIRVVDRHGRPVEGARVRLHTESNRPILPEIARLRALHGRAVSAEVAIETDKDGSNVRNDVRPGTLVVTARHPQREGGAEPVTVEVPGGGATVDVELLFKTKGGVGGR